MKSNKSTFFGLFFCLLSFLVNAQAITLLERIPLIEGPVSVSIDRTDHIYLAGEKGNVYKYDETGELLLTYSPQKPGRIKSMEAWSTLNVFIFYEGLQEFSFLDRFLTHISTQRFGSDIYARLATSSSDNNLWIFDDQDYSLKKINLNYFEPQIMTPLSNIINKDFTGRKLKEYQNFLFLSDENTGVYVFDNLGNYIKLLPFTSASFFNFHKTELYFLNNSRLEFYDLYSAETRSVEIPTGNEYLYALVTENYLYLISKKFLDIYLR